jgi:hypothetical protein
MFTARHGISIPARSRSINQGVCPPLTAITNMPRAVMALRASSAMIAAALLATASESESTSMFIGAPVGMGIESQATSY